MSKLKPLTEYNGIKLTKVETETMIKASPELVWDTLAQYGNVSSFHFGVDLSVHGDNSSDKAELGAQRTCHVRDGKTKITLVEKITEYEQGKFYRYQVVDWENFPLNVMFFAFSIRQNSKGETMLSLMQDYRLKPGFLTGLMKWKIRAMQRQILLGYKYFIETGEKNIPKKEILKKSQYKQTLFASD